MWILFVLLLFIPALYMAWNPHFGGRLKRSHQLQYARSVAWDGKQFNNLTATKMDIPLRAIPGLLKEQFNRKNNRNPEVAIPVIPFNMQQWNDAPGTPKFIWYGHSVILMQLQGKNFLIDPMFGENAAPIAPFAVKRFSRQTLALIDQLPPLDAILYSHDHYDHLDYKSLLKLRQKTKTFITALGVGRHLVHWGVPENQITELDWWQEINLEGIRLIFTPSRHFSGRGILDRFKSLWGGFVFITQSHRIFWSGDGGYGDHFKQIGEQYGPFDIGFMECGQYNRHWHQIHMFPEEAVQAALDAQVEIAMPVHWGGFALSLHSWKEPVERFQAKAELEQCNICTPAPGEIIALNQEITTGKWWETLQ